MKILSLLFALLLLPATLWGQQKPAPADSTRADSLVLVVPFRQLAQQRLDALMEDSLLDRSQLGMVVWDLTADSLLYAFHPRHLMRTASTMKLLTAVAALDRLGTAYTFATRLYLKGTVTQGRFSGDIICQGGMDPLFGRADMQAFARALHDKGVTSISGRIVTDVSMKDAAKWGAGWCWDDKNPVLTPLLYEGKPTFADALKRELRNQRISVGGIPVSVGTVPADAKLVATRTHTIDEVLRQMMKESDNLFAESTYYQLAASSGHRPAKAGDAQRIEQALLDSLGLTAESYRLADGSGLSLYDYLTPEAQVLLLRHAWQQPALYEHLLASLPIAGEDGTLQKRMTGTAAQGNVRAKTGTVAAVSALSGYLTALDGHRLCFCIVNQGLKRTSDGRDFQDRVCLALCQP